MQNQDTASDLMQNKDIASKLFHNTSTSFFTTYKIIFEIHKIF